MVLAILFTMAAGCGATVEQLEKSYYDCQKANMVVKQDSRGAVALDEDRQPIMVPKKGACEVENQAYNEAYERRETMRENKARMALWCPGGALVCGGNDKCIRRDGTISPRCSCSCQSRDEIQDIFGRWPN
jgi:hypothetical protein